MTFMLATSDETTVTLAVVNLIVTALLTLGFFALNNRQRRIETLEKTIGDKTADSVEEKLTALKADLKSEFAGPIASLQSEAHRVERRLEVGEAEFKELREEDNKLRLEIITRLDRVSEKIDGQFARQADIRRVEERISKLEQDRQKRGGSQ